MAQRGRPRYPYILTPREQEVLALLRGGLTNDQIAERLGISFDTAKTHVAQILSKLGVESREEAAAWRPERGGRFGRIVLAIAGTAVVTAAVAGLALLAWGSSRSGSASGTASLAGHIAYVSAAGNGYNVRVMNADGTDQRELVALTQPAGVSNLRWSADGQTLTFHGDVGGVDVSHRDYTTDVEGHWSRQPASDYVAQYSSAPKIAVDGRLQGYAIANSPDGTKVASYVGLQSSAPWSSLTFNGVTGNSETTSAWISNPDGSDAHQLTTEYGYSSPTDWSPDGK